ncbi:hypothetical protein HMJ29_04210 [Hymenobacter taeanensis]|uniref:Lipoprotein n=1 Tax=Hymenobacter taeanensis TaxID=2735321 RepID=A0A6M6BE21_9BACT|nr:MULTISPECIES: hypothetical protein [Hymenobacter]QJX46182.1 hypothetical protein HMJ29_04210 [Hymenobacter taeanensis]UOQ80038.1 hypothetical protein MUN83_14475 [Hymenobacter sp. 5414T-23]
MKTLFPLRSVAAGLLLSAALFTTACDTGTDNGDTNVERGDYKQKDPDPGHSLASDSATSGLNAADKNRPTGREQYEAAGDAQDHNRDGLAD